MQILFNNEMVELNRIMCLIAINIKQTNYPCDGSAYCTVCTIYDLLMAGF